MIGKTKVDHPLAILDARLSEGLRKWAVLINRIHLPDNVVSGEKTFERFVEAGKAGSQVHIHSVLRDGACVQTKGWPRNGATLCKEPP